MYGFEKILNKLWISLVAVGFVSAADVAPFVFSAFGDYYAEGLSDEQVDSLKKLHQDYWAELMKYKIYGEDGINFQGTNIRVTDTVGWFGTSKGDFHADGNDHHVVGGPIIIGGDMYLGNGRDTIINGPVRISGKIGQTGNFDPVNAVRGVQCISGAVPYKYEQAIVDSLYTDDTDVSGRAGGKSGNYGACPDSVPEVQEDLTIPSFHYNGTTPHGVMDLENKIGFIDVPRGSGEFDYYIDGFKFGNTSILVVRMPKGGRLTRVFVHDGINFGTAQPKVRIVYMDDDAKWVGDDNSGYWDVNAGLLDEYESVEVTYNGSTTTKTVRKWFVEHSTTVENKDYAGNLLFYSQNSFSWGALSQVDSMLGTFISESEINVKQQMTLAGQLIAKVVNIDANFDGSGFRYVPFDPPILDIDPELLKSGKWIENGSDSLVPIHLDTVPKTDVTFKYCFDVKASDLTVGDFASIDDFNKKGDKDFENSKAIFPICGANEYGNVLIKAGEKEPTDDTKIYINVKTDDVPEGDETLVLYIYDVTGAVMPGNKREGTFKLTITDMSLPRFDNDDKDPYEQPESTLESPVANGKVIKVIDLKNVPWGMRNSVFVEMRDTNLVAGAVSATELFDFVLDTNATTKEVKAVILVKDSSILDYEKVAPDYDVVLTLKQIVDETTTIVADTIIREINVTDVNETPTIDYIEEMNKEYTGTPTKFVLYPNENLEKGDSVGVIHASDPDIRAAFNHLEYAIVDPDKVPFELHGDTIVVKDPSALNYEKNPIIKFEVEVVNREWNPATDKPVSGGSVLSTKETVTVMLQDVHEAPVISCKSTETTAECEGPFAIKENSATNTVIHECVVTEEDVGQIETLVPSITDKKTGGNATDLFDVVIVPPATAGGDYLLQIIVKDKDLLDYESKTVEPSYEVAITVTDVDGLSATISRTIDIIDVNENPTLTKQDFHVNEHVPINTPVDTVKGGDLDSLIAYRDNVCFAFAGDKDLFTVDSNCVITTKKELDYETMDSTFILVVKLRDRTDTNLFAIDTMTIHLHNINERPTILTDSLHVKENSPKGTDVGKLVATDPDKNDTKTFTLVSDPSGCFVVSSEGAVTVKTDKCSDLNYEKNTQLPIVVRVTDSGDSSHTKTIYVKIDNVPEPEIEITKAENTDTTWTKPDTLYTNQKHLDVCWEVNGKNETCADTSLKTGENRICKEVCNVEGFEGCARDCIIAYYSNVSPKVKISAATGSNLAGNIYTIVEQPAKGDTSVYVKDTVSKVSVMIIDNDPLKSKSDTTSFTIPVDLTKKISVPQTTYDALSNVAKQTVALDVAHEGATHTPVNGSKVLVSYTEKVGGMNVEVSYVTDKNGNVVKQPVVNSKGKIDSVEVMTVSYQTVVGGDTVTVSYQADALTGKMLYADGNGSLSKHSDKSTGSFKISYDYVDKATGHSVELTYVVDSKGNMVKNSEGDRGYQVSFTYVDQYGNAAKKSVFVVLDQTLPVVKILSPEQGNVIRSNFVDVKWSINGVEQDTLTMQGLEKGANAIVRFYRDKAGNEASDTVTVVMKDSKEIEIAVEQPVTMVSADKVKEYYAKNPPKSGQTYAVSILNPSTGKEVETLIGGSFGNKSGSGKDPYKGSSKHLGPTLSLDLKLPTVDGLGGLATLDDLILSNGKISNKGIGIDTSKLDAKAKEGYAEYTVEEYVAQYCEDGTEVPSDVSKFNLYDSKLQIKLWVYTTLGNFVNYYTFTQELNDPSYTNEAALLQMFFEMKPDKDGYVHADNGKLLATGAYVYKVEAKLTNKLRCSIPPLDDNSATAKKKGDVIKTSDDLLKPFGYKRPKNK